MVRTSVDEMDKLIGVSLPVLDHGFVRIVDYMGSDSSVVQAARVSYGSGTKGLHNDKALIDFLMRHRHTSPFEMCEIKLHVKLPIFVARQWIRHRTANVNEISARYSVVEDEFFIPQAHEIGVQSQTNMQCREGQIDHAVARNAIAMLELQKNNSYEAYQSMLESGVPRELARMCLGVNCYTQFYWKIDLHNLLHFLFLRSGKGAQQEIQKYAKIILGIVEKWTPLVYEAFMKYRMNSVTLSSREIALLHDLLCGKKIDFDSIEDMSAREIAEFKELFCLDRESA